MKRFRKVYVEISNVCNLRCAFCPGTKRRPRVMTPEEFSALLPKLAPYTDYLYFHLMGEPLCHPYLGTFLEMAGNAGFKVILTTNGTLLRKQQELLLSSPTLHKINISLHAFEANDLSIPFEDYLAECLRFGQVTNGRIIVSYRLWNSGGKESLNDTILDTMKEFFPQEWVHERHGLRIADRVYLEHGDKFDWPDLSAEVQNSTVFCYGLRDQIGVLCDGTVVPCCLDHEGDIALGNLFTQELPDILESKRAKSIYEGFSHRTAMEELCRKCGYASRFQ